MISRKSPGRDITEPNHCAQINSFSIFRANFLLTSIWNNEIIEEFVKLMIPFGKNKIRTQVLICIYLVHKYKSAVFIAYQLLSRLSDVLRRFNLFHCNHTISSKYHTKIRVFFFSSWTKIVYAIKCEFRLKTIIGAHIVCRFVIQPTDVTEVEKCDK